MEKVIGIEVKGEVYRIEDEETSGKTQTLETKVATAEANIENLETAATEQAEKVAKIETNIGETDISELSETVAGHTDELTEISEDLPKIKAEVEEFGFTKNKKPRFVLEQLQPVAKAQLPTISQPCTLNLQGQGLSTDVQVNQYLFSLDFYDDCVCARAVNTYLTISGQPSSFYVGWTHFRMLSSWLTAKLKEKYPARSEEIDDYMANKFPNLRAIGTDENPMPIVMTGEDDTVAYLPQRIYGEKLSDGVVGITLQLMPTISVSWDLEITKVNLQSVSSYEILTKN